MVAKFTILYASRDIWCLSCVGSFDVSLSCNVPTKFGVISKQFLHFRIIGAVHFMNGYHLDEFDSGQSDSSLICIFSSIAYHCLSVWVNWLRKVLFDNFWCFRCIGKVSFCERAMFDSFRRCSKCLNSIIYNIVHRLLHDLLNRDTDLIILILSMLRRSLPHKWVTFVWFWL